jgi:hypothetical protein
VDLDPARAVGAAAALLAAAALAFAACGEKGEPAGETTGATAATTTTTAPEVPGAVRLETVADYNAAADTLCAEAMAEQESLRRRLGGRQLTLGDRARLLAELGPVRSLLGEDLAHLTPVPPAIEEQARELVAAARRRGIASSEAGRLYERGGSRAAIADAAAAEHDERVLFVEIATDLGMRECAERLPRAEQREVAATVEQGLGSGPARQRCAAFGERYLNELYDGGLEECEASGAGGLEVGVVDVGEIVGIEEVFAQAEAVVDRGGAEVSYRVRITYEDGAYRIDKLE